LDNAPSNGTLVNHLALLVPTFRGAESRVRCFPHIINLMAKSFMSLFSPPPRRRKSGETNATTAEVDTGAPRDPDDSTKELDPDKLEHNNRIVEGIAAKAREMMASQGILVTDSVLASARKIMYKVSGLARRVNDSPTLEAAFRDLVDKDPDLTGDQRALSRRVATRWNTDRVAIDSHIHFKGPVQWLTGNAKYNLKQYALDNEQWNLAIELSSVLQVFQEPTDRFSQAKVPLVHNTLPELLSLKARLEDIRDDFHKVGIHSITCVAAQAALLLYDKYIGTMEESDIYKIAVVMCPDRKLKWFSDRGYDTEAIRTSIVSRFKATYAPEEPANAHTVASTNESVSPKVSPCVL
ncbi:hypothetical protein BDV93DRAFT_573592, partial [Ceratobasidium sp. AG-I]